MKRFLLFTFDDYYPSGGWNDFHSGFDTLECAQLAATTSRRDRYNIVDTQTGEIVEER